MILPTGSLKLRGFQNPQNLRDLPEVGNLEQTESGTNIQFSSIFLGSTQMKGFAGLPMPCPFLKPQEGALLAL